MSRLDSDCPQCCNTTPTLYDETLRDHTHEIQSVENNTNLLGYLDHHDPTSGGSVGICVASGKGIMVKQALWESIPEEHKPALDKSYAGTTVNFLTSGQETMAIGSIFLPILLRSHKTGLRFRIKVLALVIPNLLMGIYIGFESACYVSQEWSNGVPMHTFRVGEGELVEVKGYVSRTGVLGHVAEERRVATTGCVESPPSQPSCEHEQAASEHLIGPTGLRALELVNQGGRVELSYLRVEGQPFSEAIRANIQQIAGTVWDIQLRTCTLKPINEHDVMLATIYFRMEHSCEESGEGRAEFIFELASDPWTKSAQYLVRGNRKWKKFFIPFVAGQSYAAGEAQISLRLGFTPRIVDIGGLNVENFHKKLTFGDLPKTTITYPGMAADAPWRKAADERIDKIRKGLLRVVVIDGAGKPVPSAAVNATLVKHAFAFGTCVPSVILISGGHDKFKRIVPELFNTATLENDLKWAPLSGDWGPDFTLDRGKQGIKWLRDRGLSVRGHTLVWPGWKNLPEFLQQYKNDPTQLYKKVQCHVRELAAAMEGSLVHWDVVNEPFDNHDILDILGPEVMVDWFKEAHAADPSAKLFINDYGILSGGGGTTPHRDHYEKTIKMLVDKGAPLDGIGMEGHFGCSLTSPDDMLAILDRYAKYGIPIWATEYDVEIDDDEVSGRFTCDFYTALFSHPSVKGIVMWGFWDGAHWKNNAVMYRQDWSLKQSGEAIRELLLKTWHTDASGTTDPQGACTMRAFLGDYVIQVCAAGKTKSISTQLEASGTDVVITLN